ncbi:MAG: tRNA uridine-5-carboxymethylaminomethyl(34) synthesis GTPase MnmE [Bacteroidetes bacterium]|nr:tRNA uridine-5-carboxymethylaminomethyl(34) synthesis GTPase MnmE [Bacteroidota bacterium]
MQTPAWKDTIVALATPAGPGAIGIIRLSGENAWQIATALFPGKDLLQQASHTLHVGMLSYKEQPLDEAVVSLYKSPRSYTGEDVVEISCHGSGFILQSVLAACTQLGARMAKPGEFTLRAFLNGKMDLAQAESVADLITSQTQAAQRTALHALRGGYSSDLKQLREQLIQFSALIELELDFSQEDVTFADRTQLRHLIQTLKKATNQLLDSFRLGNVIKQGVSVAIIGKPNAGKSTLLNALLNENRAIVSDIPGTTRDTIEECIQIKGILFRFIDTAGIRENATDVIEAAGIARSQEKIRSADWILYLFDAQEAWKEMLGWKEQADRAGLNYLLVANKIDVSKPPERSDVIPISALQQVGLDLLKNTLFEKVVGSAVLPDTSLVTNARHLDALQRLAQSLIDIEQGLDNQIPGDLLALDIHRGLQYLGEITGEITSEDQLDYIFSKFCIGK